MNAFKTKIRIDARRLLEEYQYIRNNSEEPYHISSSEKNTVGSTNTCFSGSTCEGMRVLNTVLRDDTLITERTKACVGYINKLVDFFPEAVVGGWATFNPGFSFKPHIDYVTLTKGFSYGNPGEPQNIVETFRIRGALETNPFCYLAYENGEIYHIPVDNHLWMIKTNIRHTAWNMGISARTHVALTLPMFVWDKYANHCDVII